MDDPPRRRPNRDQTAEQQSEDWDKFEQTVKRMLDMPPKSHAPLKGQRKPQAKMRAK